MKQMNKLLNALNDLDRANNKLAVKLDSWTGKNILTGEVINEKLIISEGNVNNDNELTERQKNNLNVLKLYGLYKPKNDINNGGKDAETYSYIYYVNFETKTCYSRGRIRIN